MGTLLGVLSALSLVGMPAATAAAAKTHRVRITKFTFQPAVLTIFAGDKVEWINEDFAPHTATERETGAWDTGELGKGEAAGVTFDAQGSYDYYCVFHPHMRGRIVVI
ncbi:MAG: cupredoxin family copper-binding protein [Pseudomonadota bacterium]